MNHDESIEKVGGGKKGVVLVLVLVSLVSIGLAVYFYSQVVQLKSANSSASSQANQAEAQQIIAKVGQLMVLPTGESPTVATVTDLSQLKGQPFFANATKGDKVLIYTNAKKAILYSPTMNKIVEVAPISIGSGK